MFCDLVGSTALSEKLDTEELRSLLHAYRSLCGEVIARYDGSACVAPGGSLLSSPSFRPMTSDVPGRDGKAAHNRTRKLCMIEV